MATIRLFCTLNQSIFLSSLCPIAACVKFVTYTNMTSYRKFLVSVSAIFKVLVLAEVFPSIFFNSFSIYEIYFSRVVINHSPSYNGL
jgi:hypothetical protein